MKRVRAKSASKKQEKASLKAALAAEGVAKLAVIEINKQLEKLKDELAESEAGTTEAMKSLMLTLKKKEYAETQLIPMRKEYTDLYSAIMKISKDINDMTDKHEVRKKKFAREIEKLVSKEMTQKALLEEATEKRKENNTNYRVGRDKNHDELVEARKVLADVERDILSKKRVQEKLGAVLVDASAEAEAAKKNAMDIRKRAMVHAKAENVLIDRIDDLKRSEQVLLKSERAAHAGMKKAKADLDAVNQLTLVKGNAIRLLDKRENEIRKHYERAGLTFKK